MQRSLSTGTGIVNRCMRTHSDWDTYIHTCAITKTMVPVYRCARAHTHITFPSWDLYSIQYQIQRAHSHKTINLQVWLMNHLIDWAQPLLKPSVSREEGCLRNELESARGKTNRNMEGGKKTKKITDHEERKWLKKTKVAVLIRQNRVRLRERGKTKNTALVSRRPRWIFHQAGWALCCVSVAEVRGAARGPSPMVVWRTAQHPDWLRVQEGELLFGGSPEEWLQPPSSLPLAPLAEVLRQK